MSLHCLNLEASEDKIKISIHCTWKKDIEREFMRKIKINLQVDSSGIYREINMPMWIGRFYGN